MGMDLYSVYGGKYYRFNWSGWGRLVNFLESLDCDLSEFSGSNNGDVVSEESCLAIADRLDEVNKELSRLITMPAKDLPLELSGKPIIFYEEENEVDVRRKIIEARMKGEKLKVSILKYDDDKDWDFWNGFAYYLVFRKFCRACSTRGGFRQC